MFQFPRVSFKMSLASGVASAINPTHPIHSTTTMSASTDPATPSRKVHSTDGMVFYVFLLALVVLQIVALGMLVGPLFKARNVGSEYLVTLTTPNNDLQRAFTVVFWVTVVLSIVGPIVTAKAHGTRAATFVGTLIVLALTVLCWVGVGYLTAETWKKRDTRTHKYMEGEGKVVLRFKKGPWVVLKITSILLLIAYGLPVAFFLAEVTRVGLLHTHSENLLVARRA